jgi:putative hydrolase of HD superfamily
LRNNPRFPQDEEAGMITKNRPPLASFEGKNVSPLVQAYLELNQLKLLYRQGWLRHGLPPEQCESVAEHIYGMVMLVWWIIDGYSLDLDRERVLRMVLVHELGEIYTGDIIPGDQVAVEEKHARELESLWQVAGKLGGGREYLALWEEFEAGETREARFVRQVDRLEMAFQAAVYEQQGIPAGEFFASAEAALVDPLLREIFDQLLAIRN